MQVYKNCRIEIQSFAIRVFVLLLGQYNSFVIGITPV
jgi:hypothetical protein